ncbi:hypothetical protein ACIRVK_36750 [Streptomyces sp. NPDC101152]|uniref:hypothetical protein n=1 Tax=Streptomyces sp. NPDC101152 TaxID=3366116 RepID=UPI003829A1E2
MQLTVLDRFRRPAEHAPGAYLESNEWDDHSFKTFFTLWCSDGQRQVKVGNVRIATFGMGEGPARVSVPETFEELDSSQYFSLGTDETYYERLKELGDETRETVLQALQDLAFGPREKLGLALFEDVTRVSLMRGIELATIMLQFSRIAHGGEALTPYHFTYTSPPFPGAGATPPLELSFDVTPHVQPPTNVHVLIGRNGVGKSHILNGITRTLIESAGEHGTVAFAAEADPEPASFANVVSVSFSAFDEFEPIETERDDLTYAYVGLKKPGKRYPMPPGELAAEFAKSTRECHTGSERRSTLWRQSHGETVPDHLQYRGRSWR